MFLRLGYQLLICYGCVVKTQISLKLTATYLISSSHYRRLSPHIIFVQQAVCIWSNQGVHINFIAGNHKPIVRPVESIPETLDYFRPEAPSSTVSNTLHVGCKFVLQIGEAGTMEVTLWPRASLGFVWCRRCILSFPDTLHHGDRVRIPSRLNK